jgi:ABC-type dipeptide/oligopeptide/nickel transport system permease subunit
MWLGVLAAIAALCVLLPMLLSAIGRKIPIGRIFRRAGSCTSGHWLGTDCDQERVLIRACYGGRLSLLIASAATSLIALIVGTAYGVLAPVCGNIVAVDQGVVAPARCVFGFIPLLVNCCC